MLASKAETTESGEGSMRNRLIGLAIFGAIAVGMSSVATAQNYPAPSASAAAGFRDGNRTAQGDVVVLRGSRSANSNIGQPAPDLSGEGYGSTDNGPPGPSCPIGWDCGGLDPPQR